MSEELSVARTLARAQSCGVDRLDAQLLLAAAVQRSRTWLLAHDEIQLDEQQVAVFATLCARRRDSVPIAYLVGEREFHGLMLRVNPDVLVPRPDTETLVDWALELLRGPLGAVPRPAVVDLGTGSGAIALAVAHRHPRARVLATDLSAAALEVARSNAQRLGIAVEFAAGRWWEPLADRQMSLALSNPPYIAPGDPHLDALRHEPEMALVAADGGLAAIVQIAKDAPAHLLPGAWLLVEHGHQQATEVREQLRRAGLEDIRTRRDIAGHERCSGARQPI